jgi:hypothetical protein
MVGMRIGPADSELADGFAADDAPVSVFLDFVESPHPRLVFEIEEPESMPVTIRAAGERDRCFSFLILDDTPVSIGSAYSAHRFYVVERPLGRVCHNQQVRSTSPGGYKLILQQTLPSGSNLSSNDLGKGRARYSTRSLSHSPGRVTAAPRP